MEPYFRADGATVYLGDCLDVLANLPAESVDLCYMDPPFNTGKTWAVRHADGDRTFEDRFPSLGAYVDWVRERCAEVRRVLKPTGSLWLHQDPHHGASYLKLMLDGLFGIENFRADVVWKRKHGTASGQTNRRLPRSHDSILVYGKTEAAETAPECNGKDPCSCTDMWLDIPGPPPAKERVGYPTQKPLALLERIVRAGSPPGGVVLDPFAGSGTTLLAALKLGRSAIGVDESAVAARVASERIAGLAPAQLALEVP